MAGIERLEIQKGLVDYLIIDEACQAVETSSLIPFDLEPKKLWELPLASHWAPWGVLLHTLEGGKGFGVGA